MNRQNAAIRSMYFLSFITHIAYWRTKSSCVNRQCAGKRKKNLRNKIWILKTQQNWTASPNGARRIIASIYWCRNTYFHFWEHSFYLSICIFTPSSLHLPYYLHLHLPPHPHLPPHLYLPPISISLTISIFLAISVSIHYTSKQGIQKGGKQFAAFCLFMGTLPKNCALIGGNGNTLKLKTSTKL